MKFNEYKERAIILKHEYQQNLIELQKEFAFSNQKYHIGDIISDGYRIIRVESVKVGTRLFSDRPECCYSGIELTKKLEAAKKQRGYEMWENEVKKQRFV